MFLKIIFFRLFNGYKQKVYQAVLLQSSYPFCGSQELRHNGRLKTEIRYPAANASQSVIIRLFKQRVWCRTCNKRSMAQSDLVSKYCCISQSAKLKILSALTENSSMTSIAREMSIRCKECWALARISLIAAMILFAGASGLRRV